MGASPTEENLMTDFRIGVDIGGTFTDIVFLGGDGQVLTRKVASTPDDYSRAVLNGIRAGMEELGIEPGAVSEVGHGFTVATNAIIEQKGAHTALITTEGFRDVLEFRRNRTPRLYDLYYEKPPALVKRQHRLEVGERLNFRGESAATPGHRRRRPGGAGSGGQRSRVGGGMPAALLR